MTNTAGVTPGGSFWTDLTENSQRTGVWLARYAVFTAVATLGLIGLGGLVTSHGVGMAVPDWPTTYGYNMFLFPVSQWVGGIFYEHTHRLYASLVGLLTVILAVWLQWRAEDRRLARLGWLALVLVIVQGVLGGLRVELMKDQIGVLHAALAQVFLVLLSLIALFCTRAWGRARGMLPAIPGGLARLVTVVTAVIFLQLLLGATMRHQHAGLAVPDFPLAYGRVWPPTDEAFLQNVNALRTDTRDFHPITAFQVVLHMVHRWLGVGLGIAVMVAAVKLRRGFGPGTLASRLAWAWGGLILVQVVLGAATVWSNKAADVATAHVVVGACCLVIGAMATVLCRAARRVGVVQPLTAAATAAGSGGAAPGRWVTGTAKA